MNKKHLFNSTNLLLIIIPTIIGAVSYTSLLIRGVKKTIKVGILHSSSGTMGPFEKTLIDTTLLAINEINENGGLLNKLIEPIIVDGMSNPQIFAQEAEKLITQCGVEVIFGCWTSSSRKMVKSVVEKYNKLLFYSVQYEGLEESPNIIYNGASPNQQIIPTIFWSLKNIGKRFFLIGSDNTFSHAAHHIIKGYCAIIGGTITGEEYINLGSHNINKINKVVQKIKTASADVIINTINGDSNLIFFQQLRNAGIKSEKMPTLSFCLGESEFKTVGIKNIIGDYVASSYFKTVENQDNEIFLKKLREKFGSGALASESNQNAYTSVNLWAKAVTKAQSITTQSIKKAIQNLNYPAPEGIIYIDKQTLHTWKMLRIGKIMVDGNVKIIWDSKKPLTPISYPPFLPKTEWGKFLTTLYTSWGNQWESPKDNA